MEIATKMKDTEILNCVIKYQVFKKHVDMVLQGMVSRHGGDGLTVGLDDLRSLFQPL